VRVQLDMVRATRIEMVFIVLGRKNVQTFWV